MEYKTLDFELAEVDAETGVFEGYASVFDVIDLGGDMIERGAFTKTLQERAKRVRLCHQHDWKEVIGKPIELREDDHGLWIKAQLALDVQRAREDYALLKMDALDGLSIGYDPIKVASGNTTDGNNVRVLKEIKLYEISLVTEPMNQLSLVTSVKEAPEPEQPAGAEPDESPLTPQQLSAKALLDLHQLSQKYLGG